MVGKIKNIFIAALFAATLFQVNALWFSGTQSFSLLGVFKPSRKTLAITDEAKEAFARPYRIAIGKGGGIFDIYYAPASSLAQYKEQLDAIILRVVSAGEFVSSGTADRDEMFNAECIIYDYAVTMPFGDFAKAFSGASGSALSRVDNFKFIYITQNGENSVLCRFVKSDGSYSEFAAKTEYVSFPSVTSEHFSPLTYTYSGSLEAGEIFEGAALIPSIKRGWIYSVLIQSNPYAVGGDVLLGTVEKYTDAFFDTPAVKWRSSADPFTFSDDTTVVRYYSSNVLEYSNFTVSEESGDSLLSAFALAYGMIERDETITNEWYLSDLWFADGVWHFGFDYTEGGFPVSLSNMKKERTGMNSMIEATVANGNVTKYRRYVCSLKVRELPQGPAEFSYTEALGAISGEGGEGHVLSFDFAYVVDDEQNVALNWVMKSTGGAAYMFPVE